MHGECGARAYNGGLGAEPPSGGQGMKPPETESILVIGCPTEPANLAPVRENSMLCYGPLVSELGEAECMVPPTPSLGACAPRPSRLRRLWPQHKGKTVETMAEFGCGIRSARPPEAWDYRTQRAPSAHT